MIRIPLTDLHNFKTLRFRNIT